MIENEFREIVKKHEQLISLSTQYMKKVKDDIHSISHVLDTIDNVKEILKYVDANREVCIISAFWHDVGRSVQNDGHEKISADMLKDEMKKLNYSDELISKCYETILHHKWDMIPPTLEGFVLKDADKLAFLGERRWKKCLEDRVNLNDIINLLPKLKNEILILDCSKEILYNKMVNIIALLHNDIFDINE